MRILQKWKLFCTLDRQTDNLIAKTSGAEAEKLKSLPHATKSTHVTFKCLSSVVSMLCASTRGTRLVKDLGAELAGAFATITVSACWRTHQLRDLAEEHRVCCEPGHAWAFSKQISPRLGNFPILLLHWSVKSGKTEWQIFIRKAWSFIFIFWVNLGGDLTDFIFQERLSVKKSNLKF